MSAAERAQKRDDELDNYEVSLGLPRTFPQENLNQATRLLSLTPTALRTMSAWELGEGAFVLTLFAGWLQRVTNKHKAQVKWAEESLRYLIGAKAAQLPFYNPQERLDVAIASNDAAQRIEQLRVEATLKLERISYLSANAKDLAMTLMSLKKEKGDRE